MKNLEKNYSEVVIKIDATGETRKPAFAFFNRDVNLKHVDLIYEKMKVKGYRECAPIQVVKAEEAEKFGIIKLYDLNKNPIPESEFNQYALVGDGQHRAYATSKYNDWLKSEGEEPIPVPANYIQLKNGESLVEYLNEINITLKEWTKEDFLNGAANVNQDEPLLQRYQELIKRQSNRTGMSLSTLNLIYCNSSGALVKDDLVLLCYGIKTKGKANKTIIPSNNLEIGDQFIQICKKVGFRDSEIAKRYLITEFNNLRNAKDNNFALNVFKLITQDDARAMLNNYEHLDEENVISQIKIVEERYLDSLKNKMDNVE